MEKRPYVGEEINLMYQNEMKVSYFDIVDERIKQIREEEFFTGELE